MKTLKEHNEQRSRILLHEEGSNNPALNGISCPQCSSELYDSAPWMMLASNPPQKNIHCGECGFTGYRIA